MEGLIPFLLHAIKRNNKLIHQQSFRCLSDGSRRGYEQLLGSAGDSFNGSSHHRRTQSEFQPPSTIDLQPEVEEFIRSRSFKGINNDSLMVSGHQNLRQTHYAAAAYRNFNYNDNNKNEHGSRGIKKFD